MLGPSPDWIVGVSGLELCLRNCSWAEEREVFLYPWDAGVDSGVSYESPDQPTFPPQPITRSAICYQDQVICRLNEFVEGGSEANACDGDKVKILAG